MVNVLAQYFIENIIIYMYKIEYKCKYIHIYFKFVQRVIEYNGCIRIVS